MGHVDKSGQCALIHAGLRGHPDIIHYLLNQDWGPTEAPEGQQQHGVKSSVKGQALQQALTAACSMGQTHVGYCVHTLTNTHTPCTLFRFNLCVLLIIVMVYNYCV